MVPLTIQVTPQTKKKFEETSLAFSSPDQLLSSLLLSYEVSFLVPPPLEVSSTASSLSFLLFLALGSWFLVLGLSLFRTFNKDIR